MGRRLVEHLQVPSSALVLAKLLGRIPEKAEGKHCGEGGASRGVIPARSTASSYTLFPMIETLRLFGDT